MNGARLPSTRSRMDARDGIERVGRAAAYAERTAAPWIERLARFGYAAKGVVYVLIGGIAARVAFGEGGDVEGWNGSLETLRDESLGTPLLWLIGIGLLGHVVWRAVGALRNPENEDAGHRAFYAFSALVYAGLALEALRLATGGGGSGGDTHWTVTLMEKPFGRALVLVAGLGIAGYGIQQLWRAWTVKLDERLDLSRLSATARIWVVRLGRAGLAARGIVFLVLGWTFLSAARRAGASESDNVEGVLGSMRDQPGLLGAVALGLVAYGLYNIVLARYRRIRAA